MTTRISRFLCVLILLTAACGNNDRDSIADLTIPVGVDTVQRGDIAAYISTTGTIQPQHEEQVVTAVEGVLNLAEHNGRPLAAGQEVRAGQALGAIDNPEYLLEVRVESQKMAMDNAQRELEKQQVLFSEGGITEKELEQARRSALDAKLNYEAALLKAQKVQILAPISGYIAGLQSSANGTRVQAGFRLCTVMDYAAVLAPVKLPNTDLERIRPGQEALISNYALPDAVFSGRITSIDPTIDPQTRTFSATIRAPNDMLRLKPGMFVKVDIVLENHEQAIVIPKTALQIRDNRPVAFIVEGASAEMREVTLGIETRDEVEIVEGLSEGERLVVKGHETLRDKSKVRVTE